MTVSQATERVFVWLASATVAAFAVAHLLGRLERGSWFIEHMPTIGVLLMASLLPALVHIIDHRVRHIEETMEALRQSHDRDMIERLSDVRSRIDRNLEAVFGDHITNMLTSIERAVRERYVELHDVDLFRSFYKRTLSAFPKSTFFATSLPRQKYFWKNPQLDRAIREFTDRGGSMKRIFFLSHPSDAEDAEVKEILLSQLAMGIEVFVADREDVPQALRHLFVVESQALLAWEVDVGPNSEIEHIRATCDPKITRSYVRNFDELLTLETTRKYDPKEGRVPVC